MKNRIKRLSIRTQLLLFVIPIIVVIISINSFVIYKNSAEKLLLREKDKKENIKNGVSQFIDNYDLSLQLIEQKAEIRFRELFNEIFDNYITGIENQDLDSVKTLLKMDIANEDLYIIDKKGIVINTTKSDDLGLNFYNFGKTYKTFLQKVWKEKTLFIERIANENVSNTPKKYAYQAINDDYILEIGIKSENTNTIIENLDLKLKSLASRYSNIKSIDLFGGTEALVSKTGKAKIDSSLIDLAVMCFEKKLDTTYYGLNHIRTNFTYLEMRNSEYFNGYVLQIVSDDSLEVELVKKEGFAFLFRLFLILFVLITLLIIATKLISKPIEKLTEIISQMAKENEVENITISGNSEVIQLSQAFNQLTTQINDYSINLSNKVEERTIELNAKNQELDALLQERNTLIKEIHHRVKNNLQIIASLLRLQSRNLSSEIAKEAFKNSISRVQAMALLHERLYLSSNFITVRSVKYLTDLIELLKNSIGDNINIIQKGNDAVLSSSQAISLGLIISEFVSNSLKHAFEIDEKGEIIIELLDVQGAYKLIVSNNGRKLNDNFKIENQESLGMTIIDAFVDKLNGQYNFHNNQDGVELVIDFPKELNT